MPRKNLHLTWSAEYLLKGNPDGPLVILLHGFQQTGKNIYQQLETVLDSKYQVLVPTAPFPVPFKTALGYQMGFTWYFYNPATNSYFLDMDFPLNYIKSLVGELDLLKRNTIIIGYSQGGYLAPFLGTKLEKVSQVIGINCRFRDEALPLALPFRLDGIHGKADPLVDPIRAEQCHQAIMERGNRGTFRTLEHAGHEIGQRALKALAEQLENPQ